MLTPLKELGQEKTEKSRIREERFNSKGGGMVKGVTLPLELRTKTPIKRGKSTLVAADAQKPDLRSEKKPTEEERNWAEVQCQEEERDGLP